MKEVLEQMSILFPPVFGHELPQDIAPIYYQEMYKGLGIGDISDLLRIGLPAMDILETLDSDVQNFDEENPELESRLARIPAELEKEYDEVAFMTMVNDVLQRSNFLDAVMPVVRDEVIDIMERHPDWPWQEWNERFRTRYGVDVTEKYGIKPDSGQ